MLLPLLPLGAAKTPYCGVISTGLRSGCRTTGRLTCAVVMAERTDPPFSGLIAGSSSLPGSERGLCCVPPPLWCPPEAVRLAAMGGAALMRSSCRVGGRNDVVSFL